MPGESYRRDQVVSIINSVISKISQPQEHSVDIIRQEIANLKDMLEDLRSQLSMTDVRNVHAEHIPSATDELDAVAGATEAATMTIMDACEKILQAQQAGAGDDAIEGEVTRIYEACTFQDITGQRIGKVVRTLKTIDEKIHALLRTIGDIAGEDRLPPAPANNDSLLNGPSSVQQGGLSQDEIDRLLGSF